MYVLAIYEVLPPPYSAAAAAESALFSHEEFDGGSDRYVLDPTTIQLAQPNRSKYTYD